MPAVRVAGIVLLSSLLASGTDWLFMDRLVRRYYAADPEVWRPGDEGRRIMLSQVAGTLSSACLVVLALLLPGRPVALAIGMWCAGPLPVIVQQSLWMKVYPVISASHAAGWLARLLIAAVLFAWLRPAG